jgi:hypothetical protein
MFLSDAISFQENNVLLRGIPYLISLPPKVKMRNYASHFKVFQTSAFLAWAWIKCLVLMKLQALVFW